MTRFHQTSPLKKTEIVIAGFDYDLQKSVFFKSFHSNSQTSDSQNSKKGNTRPKKIDISLLDACHVSTNAPVIYFDDPAQAQLNGQQMRGWDGAIGGYNNPVLAGITEALAIYNCTPGDIAVLSLGTANKSQPILGSKSASGHEYEWNKLLFQKRRKTYLVTELRQLARSILGEPPSSANYVAAFMLGHTLPFDMSDFRLIRMNPMIQPLIDGEYKNIVKAPVWCDGNEDERIQMFRSLLEIEMDAKDGRALDKIRMLAKKWIDDDVDNQLIVTSGEPERQSGFERYSLAKAAWIRLCN